MHYSALKYIAICFDAIYPDERRIGRGLEGVIRRKDTESCHPGRSGATDRTSFIDSIVVVATPE